MDFNDNIEKYMAEKQHQPNANEIWLYFQSDNKLGKSNIFPKYRKEMKGIVWGFFTTSSKTKNLTTKNLNYK
jgi:hypothetical protein